METKTATIILDAAQVVFDAANLPQEILVEKYGSTEAAKEKFRAAAANIHSFVYCQVRQEQIIEQISAENRHLTELLENAKSEIQRLQQIEEAA